MIVLGSTTLVKKLNAIHRSFSHSLTFRNRSAFATTETELKLIAALAMIGLSRIPKNGQSKPAAIGTPSAL